MINKSKKRPHWIPVVAGLIRKENSFLLGLRPEGSSLAGVWEFPGGKIELGETPDDALKRELKEELGIEVTECHLKLTATHNYDGVGILLIFYEVPYWNGEPSAIHHKELKWVPISEINNYELPEANKLSLNRIIDSLKK